MLFTIISGFRQIQGEYGQGGIRDYTQPKFELPGSILNKSNLNGGGRSAFSSSSSSRDSSGRKKQIIGDVINHGKQDLWDPTRQIHYHATLHKGEPTLEVQIARVLMKSIVTTNGIFDPDHFRQSYINFMTTPGTHNDTYASTCHRMFFANLYFRKLDPKDCPDNDHHNVDAIDGLVLPTIVALATTARHVATWPSMLPSATSTATTTGVSNSGNDEGGSTSLLIDEKRITDLLNDVALSSASCAAVTRKSDVLEYTSSQWGQLVAASILSPQRNHQTSQSFFEKTLNSVSERLIQRQPNAKRASRLDQLLTACYLKQSLPPLFDMIAKYVPGNDSKNIVNNRDNDDANWVWEALIDNANVGGENVHRGSIFGSILGARAGKKKLPNRLIEGLYRHEELTDEIDEFCDVIMQNQAKEQTQ